MSTQVTVRLPDKLVAYADELVELHEVRSRADFIARAMDRERRRRLAERDLEILATSGEDPDMLSLVEYMSGRHPLGDLD